MSTITKRELELAKKLAYENWENDETEIGFESYGHWVTNPFVDRSGRFEFTDINVMCEYYGKENVYDFITQIISTNIDERENLKCECCGDFDEEEELSNANEF